MKIKNFLNELIIKLFAKRAIYYINGPEILPPPLTADEEAELLNSNSQEARNKLIVHNMRLVLYIAR